MSDADEFIKELERIQQGVKSFAEDMKEQGIHVGMGAHPLARCVNCGEAWPCAASVLLGSKTQNPPYWYPRTSQPEKEET